MTEVIRAGAADLDPLSEVIAEAFHDLPPSQWLIPDPGERRAVFPAYFRLYLEQALAEGVVCTTPNRAATALWLPVGTSPPAEPEGYGQRLADITGPRVRKFLAFDDTLARHHPAGVAHQHLAILAVRPGQQGLGIGSALLEFWHRQLDQDGIPAYLEASSQQARRLYLRHGYEGWPGGPVRVPGGGPVMWPMWRDPRPCDRAPEVARPGGVHVVHGWWRVFSQFTGWSSSRWQAAGDRLVRAGGRSRDDLFREGISVPWFTTPASAGRQL